jgi:peptidoglycan/LPS O-acetylase OafA/YrhL
LLARKNSSACSAKEGLNYFSASVASFSPRRSPMLGLCGASRVKLKSYFLRRLTRLEPPYILSLILSFVALIAAGRGTARSLLPHLLASCGYIHNLVYRELSPISGVAWSLEVEVQFYILVPLLVSVFSIKPNWVRRAILLGCVIGSSVASSSLLNTRANLSILYFAPFFIAGFVVSDFYVLAGATWFGKKHAIWDAVSFVGWPLVWLLPRDWEHLVLPLLLILLFFAAFKGPITSRILSIRWITNIGGMCYSIYLLHFQIIFLSWRFVSPLHVGHSFLAYFLLQAIVVLPVVLAICSIFFLTIEKPCMNRYWPRDLVSFLRRSFIRGSRCN